MERDIEISGLNVRFRGKTGPAAVVCDVSAHFPAGTVTGLIGESGSGKSVLGLSILQLLPESAEVTGTCLYEGRDLYRLDEREMCRIRGRSIALIPQNPAESLNPVLPVGRQLTECVTAAGGSPHRAAERRDALLRQFGFADPERISAAYSFQLSGGMNQRVISALGLMNDPAWIIADEPTKGLDAILRRQVYQVLREISRGEARGMLVITHDIPLAGALCDRLMVLYKGTLLEQGETGLILKNPMHPYTRGLIAALPENGMHPIRRAEPGRAEQTAGCRFYPRCAEATEECARCLPAPSPLPDGRIVRCRLYA